MAQKTGFGAILALGTTTTYLPKKTTIDGPGQSREAHKTSHLGTTGGYHTYIADDLVEGGEVTIRGFWDPLDGYPPINGPVETVTITNNDTGAATEAFPGFFTAFNATRTLGALQEFDATIKVAGAITFTA